MAYNIISSQKDASKGRFGDTEIRNFTNPDNGKEEPQHVSALEAHILDNYGALGESLVQDIGSGTYHPETNNRENFFLTALAVLGGALVGGAVHKKAKTGSWGNLSSAWDYSLGKHGIGGYIGNEWLGGNEQKALEEQAGAIATTGLSDLQEEGQQYLGGQGFLRQDLRRTVEGMDIAEGERMRGTRAQTRQAGGQLAHIQSGGTKITERSGFSTRGPSADEIIGEQALYAGLGDQYGGMQAGTEQYMLGLEGAEADFEKAKVDYISSLKQRKAGLLSDYLQATGEAYGGGSNVTAFETWLDQYNV